MNINIYTADNECTTPLGSITSINIKNASFVYLLSHGGEEKHLTGALQ